MITTASELTKEVAKQTEEKLLTFGKRNLKKIFLKDGVKC